ncbi:putative siderophore interacting protein [Phaeobacter piscinae]|uniref:Siderophore interacting protein n=1 Tax=Phaeobacter piscinae TaxID=1580596 RepID=A0AAN1LB69_9RHOB|nr:siderophore-interacting protein [Phaeobacter piscinae]ATG44220.1 putative siderophore interacting protein [Phaeobacter piscinae]AUQ73608.1 putative siderophore interacting protein [Phaeobacter piscinae]AUR36530.1 putative siderophore interacting protein [Phaeobacter piscinae]
MTYQVPHELTDHATICGLNMNFLRESFEERAKKPHHKVTHTPEHGLSVRMKSGYMYLKEQKDAIVLTAASDRPDKLFKLKGTIGKILKELQPDTFQELQWANASDVGAMPPNLQLTRVLSVEPLGTAFVRVRLQVPNLSFIDDTSIHFGIALPPETGNAPEWPYVNENGNAVWPKGDKAFHRPVYTSRTLYPEAGEMDFDVFLHESGRISKWIKQLQPGDRMAMIGRGSNGGGLLDNNKVLMFGDETAFPAIAHILDKLPAGAEGTVTLEAENGADCGYPIVAPEGISINWITRGKDKHLSEFAKEQCSAAPDHFLWFAAERQDAMRMREFFRAQGKDPQDAYVRAYWNRNG